jgi:hypothetical protein
MAKNHTSNTAASLPNQALPKNGVDTVLAAFGKQLQPGQSVSFRLVKSHKALFQQADPVNTKNAPPSDFPLIAKFPESVVRPDLTRLPWMTGRFYEQDHQTVIDEDDEDETAALEQKQQRKRRRWGSSRDATQRQWVLQDEAEFAETMLARKERKVAPNHQGSTRYEATAEHNPSQYVMLELVPNSNSSTPVFQVTVLPTPYAVHTFSQPMARNAMSLTQAEQLLQDQRSQTVTRFMMHQNLSTNNANGVNQHRNILPFSGLAATRGGSNSSKARLLGKLQQQHAVGANAEDDDDDIMADVTFRNRRKGGGSRARKELITSMADESVRVDDEGVLGGTNDTEFGGKRHFGRVHVPTGGVAASAGGAGAAAAGSGEATGAESMAMSNDFYQRDVQAEYDELDYDANEQFDDDDVDVGETEVNVDSRGFGAGDDDDNDPDADDDDDEDDDDRDVSTGGAEGLASLAGFRAMLAKARDRTTSPTNVAGAANTTGTANAGDANGGAAAATSAATEDTKMDASKGGTDDDGNSADAAASDAATGSGTAADGAAALEGKKKRKDPAGGTGAATNPQGDDDLAQIMAAAEKSALAAKQKGTSGSPDNKGGAAGAIGAGKFTGLEVDETGQRLVTLEAIRREIWLNHGSIAMKRLMKIFNIKKKSSAERQESFKSLVRELCNMIEDPVSGRKLVLKQHYAHMG